MLTAADRKRWKHTLTYFEDRYGKGKVAITAAFSDYWRWYSMNRPDGLTKEELRKEVEG